MSQPDDYDDVIEPYQPKKIPKKAIERGPSYDARFLQTGLPIFVFGLLCGIITLFCSCFFYR